MWLIVASGGQDAQNALVLSVVGIGGTLLVTIAAGLLNVWASKRERLEQQPESSQTLLFERTAVLAARADRSDERNDDSDERDEQQDRRLDQIERKLDIDDPNWRHPR